MRTPVAIMIFNRPDLTERVFAAIAKARPPKLFVIADGPRPGQVDEAEKCAATRAIIDRVDWECDVLKNYSEVNLGVGIRPATGIRWVFESVEEAIILEDDCLPHPTFFRYCDELLEKFRDDERVMHISGDNWHFPKSPYSYFFSCYCYSWGWATWRRAFQHYDQEIKLWPTLRDTSWLMDILGNQSAVEFWKRRFDADYAKGLRATTWDHQWLFACWLHRGLSILPSINLISNLGFREDSTHHRRTDDKRAKLPTVEMTFPLNHPPCTVRDKEVDQLTFEQAILRPRARTIYQKLRWKCADSLPAPLRKSISSLRSTFVSNIFTRD